MKPLVFKKRGRGPTPFRLPQPVLHITKGDTVRVISGESKGKEGKVLRVDPREGKVVIDGINVVKRHKRGTQTDEGGIIQFPAPIHASNVMLLDPKSGEPTRIRRRKDKDGTVERVSRKSGQPIPRNR
uniref:Large ribosomal subunit protein uL24 n=2 Tax=environmental samples TaxID=142185 RepID=A0A0H4T6T9_9BACT|nr:50S ribosomal protein L24, large subunit ribosomal protein L24 [uncultured Gemmatimonadetes bacterium Rifle_16ft_4_minimus_34782]AKQ04713.1 50S ribosomal protein L24, large subunit ribosomal protein L24 [uncultured Gemmatimonadetes bacterium Rifle_16ft_4_minimus_7]